MFCLLIVIILRKTNWNSLLGLDIVALIHIFSDLRSQLLSLLQSIEEMNKFNSILIERTIKHFRATNGFFKSFARDHAVKSSGVLLSKET